MYSNSGINKVILVGHVVREPRWHTDGKERWLAFTLATKETIFSAKGDYDHIENHQIKISESAAALKRCDFKKNDMLYIQGKIQTKSFTDDENIKRYKSEISATHAERLASVNSLAYDVSADTPL